MRSSIAPITGTVIYSLGPVHMRTPASLAQFNSYFKAAVQVDNVTSFANRFGTLLTYILLCQAGTLSESFLES